MEKMDKEIILTEFNGVGKLFVYKQMVSIEVSSFLIPDSKPITFTEYYSNEAIKDTIQYEETFSMIFAFLLVENGTSPKQSLTYSDSTKISLYPAIQSVVLDAIFQLSRKLGHHVIDGQTVESNTLDKNLRSFNSWGNLMIDHESDGMLVELATKIKDGSVIFSRKGCKTKKNQILTLRPLQCEIASVLESGSWPTDFLISPQIENNKDKEICIIAIFSVLEELRKQLGFYSLGEYISQLDSEDD
jgi:hypothetical protein